MSNTSFKELVKDLKHTRTKITETVEELYRHSDALEEITNDINNYMKSKQDEGELEDE